DSLRCVLNYRKPARSCESQNRIHVRAEAVEMDNDNRACPRRNAAFELFRIKAEGARFDIDKYRFRANRADGTPGCDERERRQQPFIAGPHATSSECEDERIRSRSETNSMGNTAKLPDF